MRFPFVTRPGWGVDGASVAVTQMRPLRLAQWGRGPTHLEPVSVLGIVPDPSRGLVSCCRAPEKVCPHFADEGAEGEAKMEPPWVPRGVAAELGRLPRSPHCPGGLSVTGGRQLGDFLTSVLSFSCKKSRLSL